MSCEIVVVDKGADPRKEYENIWEPVETIIAACPECIKLGVVSQARLHFDCGKCIDLHCQCNNLKKERFVKKQNAL